MSCITRIPYLIPAAVGYHRSLALLQTFHSKLFTCELVSVKMKISSCGLVLIILLVLVAAAGQLSVTNSICCQYLAAIFLGATDGLNLATSILFITGVFFSVVGLTLLIFTHLANK